MANPAKEEVHQSISEEYYQISEAILSSFPKYRPPLDFFRLNNKVAQLEQYSQKGARLTNEQVEEIRQLCAEGDLFVSRADHRVYSQYITKQLDLVLVDQNLKEAEVADICLRALEMRLSEFFEQPVKIVFDLLKTDVLVVTEYLWADPHRLKLFTRRTHRGAHTLTRHSLNCMFLGLWILVNRKTESQLNRKAFDRAAMALLLHDVGMSKTPSFILNKATPLKPEEWEKIPQHPLAGFKIMHKLDETYDEMREAVLEHHERLDGSGYPQKTKTFSQFGALTAVVDAFSSMLQERVYDTAKEPEEAARTLVNDKTRFDLTFSGQILADILSGQLSFSKPAQRTP